VLQIFHELIKHGKQGNNSKDASGAGTRLRLGAPALACTRERLVGLVYEEI
jgi:hypothetical protein